jgi:hypothetical protein
LLPPQRCMFISRGADTRESTSFNTSLTSVPYENNCLNDITKHIPEYDHWDF